MIVRIEWSESRLCRLAVVALVLGLSDAAAGEAGRLPPGAASCGECHSGAGHGMPPALGDLPSYEIAQALAGFRSGARDGTIMPRIAAGFTAEESEAIAAALGRAEPPR